MRSWVGKGLQFLQILSFLYRASFQHKKWKTNWCHYFIRILLGLYMFRAHRPIFRGVRTAVHTTTGSVSVPLCVLWPVLVTKTGHNIQSTQPEQYRHWTNGCVNSCTNSPEDGPVCPKHVEIRQYTNKIETVTSVGLYSICWPSYTSPGVSHPVTADIALCTQDNVPLHYTYLLWLLTCFIPIGLRIV